MDTQRDLFISYASEDREGIARPLAELLRHLGTSVWFDEFDLRVGDSLREKVDRGLAESRFGAVILSTAFFGKHYPVRKLNGLAQREIDGQKVILPIWAGVSAKEVRQFSPPLGDRIAARWEDGLYAVATKLLEVVRPDIVQTFRDQVQAVPLARIRRGSELGTIIAETHFSIMHNDEPQNEAELELVSSFLQEVRDWSDIWNDIEPGEQVRTEYRLSKAVRELEHAGWTIYATRRVGERKVAGVIRDWRWFMLAVLRGEPAEVLYDDDRFLVLRHPTSAA